MRALIGVVAALALIGLGVGGTLGVQALTDDGRSADCERATRATSTHFNSVFDAAADPDDDVSITDDQLDRLEQAIDITYKLCNP